MHEMTKTQFFIKFIVIPAIEAQGRTRLGFAEDVGMKEYEFYRYYRGEKNISLDRYLAVCDELGLNAKEVIDFFKHSKMI